MLSDQQEETQTKLLQERLLQNLQQELLKRNTKRWQALPGPQTHALESKADILFYGGAAGGGKSDMLLGAAYLNHHRSIIFRREYPQLKAILDRSVELFDTEAKLNKSELFWTFKDGKQIEFGAVQLVGDERKYQGRPHDLKAFDELTHFTEMQFRTLCGWMRSAKPNQRCRVIATGNPPTNSDGEWIIKFFAPWLDATYPKPAAPGELRYFTTLDGKDIEVKDATPFVHNGELVTPISRTFIPARVQDNPFYMQSGYVATLQSLPEPLRSKMLYGDFSAGQEDDPYQVIPTAWLYEAIERGKKRTKPPTPLTAIGVDVARGGKDQTILSLRYDNYFAPLLCYPGSSTPDGEVVANLIIAARTANAGTALTEVRIDVIGVGSSPYDFTKRVHANTYGMNGSEGTESRDKSGQLGFKNKRSEWYWKLREMLDPSSGNDIALPDDRELLADLCAPRWKLTPQGIQVEAKPDIIKRIGRSPDKGDAIVYASAIPELPGSGWCSYMKQQVTAAEQKKIEDQRLPPHLQNLSSSPLRGWSR